MIKENKDLISYSVYDNSNKYKSNYLPISILPKVYERIMDNQIYPYLSKHFSEYQCSFWKGFSA